MMVLPFFAFRLCSLSAFAWQRARKIALTAICTGGRPNLALAGRLRYEVKPYRGLWRETETALGKRIQPSAIPRVNRGRILSDAPCAAITQIGVFYEFEYSLPEKAVLLLSGSV
jgi:hypothetical protein